MSWAQLILTSTRRDVPHLSRLLEEAGALAVTWTAAGKEAVLEPGVDATPLWHDTRVTGLFASHAQAQCALDHLRDPFQSGGLPPHRIEKLEERIWEREWMDHFQPTRIGDTLWILPSWCPPKGYDGAHVVLDPGLAFGTGTHATTVLCLEWLESADLVGKSVLDYGCGSGILALAAVELGARHVYAVDNDPQALMATRENARRNGSSKCIKVVTPEALPNIEVDALVANILTKSLIALAPRFAACVRAGGALALSGILSEQADQVARTYTPWFEMQKTDGRDDWVRLVGRRRLADA